MVRGVMMVVVAVVMQVRWVDEVQWCFQYGRTSWTKAFDVQHQQREEGGGDGSDG